MMTVSIEPIKKFHKHFNLTALKSVLRAGEVQRMLNTKVGMTKDELSHTRHMGH